MIWVLLNLSSGTVISARGHFVTLDFFMRPPSVQNLGVPQLVKRHTHAAEENLDRFGVVTLGKSIEVMYCIIYL